MSDRVLLVVSVFALGIALLRPDVFSIQGLVGLITLVYAALIGRLIQSMAQYVLVHYGVSRNGVLFLSVVLLLLATCCVYYGWQEGLYGVTSLGLALVFAAGNTLNSVWNKRLGRLTGSLFLQLEYLVIGLMVLALFGEYIAQTPLGQIGIEHKGLRAESLVCLALVISASELLHSESIRLYMKIKKILKK